jgi:hypothetical protein
MTVEKQTVYSPSDVQKLLDVDESTLRKYALVMEKNGYKFHKNKRNHRGYFDKDVVALRKLLEFNEQEDMTLERSAKAVMTWVQEQYVTVSVTSEEPAQNGGERYNEMIERLKRLEEQGEQQREFNRQLLEELHKRDDYIRKRDEERDANLIHLIRETQETKKLIAATEEKKKHWWEFWK